MPTSRTARVSLFRTEEARRGERRQHWPQADFTIIGNKRQYRALNTSMRTLQKSYSN